MVLRVGTAGWALPSTYRELFPAEGTHLARYAQRFNAAEINSSFYRSHKQQTYARWAASVPDGFRFAVKVPKEITHTRRLVGVKRHLMKFIGEVNALDDRLGPLLVQLPPSLKFSADAAKFFAMARDGFEGDIVCEPRHASWFEGDVEGVLKKFKVARVAADPARVPTASVPGGWTGITYRRLHGAPRMYASSYPPSTITAIAKAMLEDDGPRRQHWCVFDNTLLGEATGNALALVRKFRRLRN